MTRDTYKQALENLNFDPPSGQSAQGSPWRLPSKQSNESYECHVVRLRQYKERYFEQLRKLEDGQSLSLL